MGFSSDFFKALFAPFNLALKALKDSIDKKDVPGVLASTTNVIKGMAIAAEAAATEVENQGAKIVGPDKKEIVTAHVEDLVIAPIVKEANEESDKGKAVFLSILAAVIRVAVPILIDRGVAELNEKGWKLD